MKSIQSQNLLNSKKEELEELQQSLEDLKNTSKKELNTQNNQIQSNNSKLYLGIGLGILGGGIIGGVIWLALRNKKNRE